MKKKMKSAFMNYPDFESISIPEDNEKSRSVLLEKYKKHVACSNGLNHFKTDETAVNANLRHV